MTTICWYRPLTNVRISTHLNNTALRKGRPGTSLANEMYHLYSKALTKEDCCAGMRPKKVITVSVYKKYSKKRVRLTLKLLNLIETVL